MKIFAETLDKRGAEVVSLQRKVHESTNTIQLRIIHFLKHKQIMAKNVNYSVSPRVNPNDRDSAPKYYGHVQANGDVSLREMSERIQQTCTVTKADVYAVLVALEDVIAESLKGGEIVRLGDLGTFRISISSKGVLKEDEYDESHITGARINFRPGVALNGVLSELTYRKVATKTSKATAAEPKENNV